MDVAAPAEALSMIHDPAAPGVRAPDSNLVLRSCSFCYPYLP
jgi:hypothetical protein